MLQILAIFGTLAQGRFFVPEQFACGSMFFLDCGRGPFAVTVGHLSNEAWRLVAVISEGPMAEDFERITAVRAHFILPDGRFSR